MGIMLMSTDLPKDRVSRVFDNIASAARARIRPSFLVTAPFVRRDHMAYCPTLLLATGRTHRWQWRNPPPVARRCPPLAGSNRTARSAILCRPRRGLRRPHEVRRPLSHKEMVANHALRLPSSVVHGASLFVHEARYHPVGAHQGVQTPLQSGSGPPDHQSGEGPNLRIDGESRHNELRYIEKRNSNFGTSNFGTSNFGTSNFGTSNFGTSKSETAGLRAGRPGSREGPGRSVAPHPPSPPLDVPPLDVPPLGFPLMFISCQSR
jgi:hypothetical protein